MKIDVENMFNEAFNTNKEVLNETKTTDAFKEWFFSFIKANKSKKILAHIGFLPYSENKWIDKFAGIKTVELFNPEGQDPENIKFFAVYKDAMNKLRETVMSEFENKLNDNAEKIMDADAESNDDIINKSNVNPDEDDFTGPDHTKFEFIINKDDEENKASGFLVRSFKTSINKDKTYRPAIYGTKDGRIMSYADLPDYSTDSPYIDGVDIPLDRNSMYQDFVDCTFYIDFDIEDVKTTEQND